MRTEMRTKDQLAVAAGKPAADRGFPHPRSVAAGATALVSCYRRLARQREHLLESVLNGEPPVQWAHYPHDDAINRDRRYQWFYHSHSPADRPDAAEHGHFHLFARIGGRSRCVDAGIEQEFQATMKSTTSEAATRSLLGISLNPQGVPVSLFTVNRWVTGDELLSGPGTLSLLDSLTLRTGHPEIDACITALTRLYRPEIRLLIKRRDEVLHARAATGPGTLDDRSLEVLSELALNADDRIAAVLPESA